MSYREHFVVYTEYERGWGSNIFHVVGYKTKEEALQKVKEENAKNTSKEVPDYYIVADYSTDLNYLKHKEYVEA